MTINANVSDNLLCKLNLPPYVFKIKNLSDMNYLVSLCCRWLDRQLGTKKEPTAVQGKLLLVRCQGTHTVRQLKN